MRNRDWLNNMALIDILSYISDHIEECLVYRIENKDFEKIENRCEKYEWDCHKCIAARLILMRMNKKRIVLLLFF